MLLTPEERRAGIGGSDVGAIMGANPYCSPIKLYKEKKGEVAPPSLNHAMEWGNILEDVIAKKYAENNNLFFCEGQRLELPDPSNYMGVVYKPSIVRGGPDGAIACEWAYAHPDFYEEVKGELSGIEVKTVSEGMYRKYWAEGEIPPWQYYQVVWYSILTGVEKWTLLGFAPHLRLSADPLLTHDLFIDADTQHRVLEKVKEFWECLESDTIPHVDKLGNNDIKLLYPENTMDMVQSSSSIDFQVKRLYAVKQLIKPLEEEEELLKNSIKAHMGKGGRLISQEGTELATFKSPRPKVKVDHKGIVESLKGHVNAHVFHKAEAENTKAFLQTRRFLLKATY
jgi:predicted phage-related endonuclease